MPGRCEDAAGTLGVFYHPEVAEGLRAFVCKAPGSLFCALKVHIKSIFTASLVFLPDVVSPLAGRSVGVTWVGTSPVGVPEPWLETSADPESRHGERRGKCSLFV